MTPIVLITGASRGIGAATARLAASRGYAVGINFNRDHAAAASIVDDIIRDGGRAIAVQADIGSASAIPTLFEEVDRQLGTVTALVNNVGVLEQQMRLDQMTADRLHRMFAVNVIGAFLCAGEAVQRMSTMRGGAGGSIVNVSSGASRLGSPSEYIDYAATKGALDTMTIGLSKEVAAEGIRVNAVRPGHIYTDIHASGGEPGRVDRLKTMVPMGRGGHADEVARAILWLLSDEASYCTGAFIDVAGGK